jgi:anti-sigma-K factor RskA
MLESLENNEVILLMYLAGELPAVDRQEVAQMLASDAVLRGELERLRETQAALEHELASLDQSEPISSAEIAVRRVGRAMRQRQVDLAVQAARNRHSAVRRAGVPFWVYPSAAAAAVLVAFLIWVIRYNVKDHAAGYARDTTNPSDYHEAVVPPPGTSDLSVPVVPNADPRSKDLADDIQNSFGTTTTDSDDTQMFALRDDPPIAVGSNVSE